MKRYITQLGLEAEVPEVDAFLNDIKAVCEQHSMWLEDDDGVSVTNDPSQSICLDGLSDARRTPERLAARTAMQVMEQQARDHRKATGTETFADRTHAVGEMIAASLAKSILNRPCPYTNGTWDPLRGAEETARPTKTTNTKITMAAKAKGGKGKGGGKGGGCKGGKC